MAYNKLPQGWVECEFEKCINKINPQKKVKQKEYLEEGVYPVIDQGQELVGGYSNNEDFVLKITSPVIVFGDHTRCFKYINFDFIAGADGTKILKPLSFFDEKLFYYFCKIIQFPDKGYSRHYQYLAKSEMRIPPLNEQKRIVEKIEEEFGKIDEGVEKLKLAQEQIKQYRQSVLKSAFEGKLYKTTEWKETELEKIITNSQIGLVRSNAEQSDVCLKEMVPYIKMNNITNDGKYDINKIVYVNASKEEIDKYKLKIGDILFNTRNSYELVGKTTIVNKLNSEKTIYNNNIMRLRFIKNIVPEFMNYQMNAIKFKKYITRAKKATTNICALYSKDLFPSPVNVPTLDEQNQIVKEIEKRFEVADEVERVISENLEKAEQLKQSILKKAFEGRLVPQDPTDEPASVLLDKIKAERDK